MSRFPVGGADDADSEDVAASAAGGVALNGPELLLATRLEEEVEESARVLRAADDWRTARAAIPDDEAAADILT